MNMNNPLALTLCGFAAIVILILLVIGFAQDREDQRARWTR